MMMNRWGKISKLKRDSKARSRCPSDQGLRLRPHGHWDRREHYQEHMGRRVRPCQHRSAV